MKDINMEKVKDKRLTVRMNWELYLKLKMYAAQIDKPMNWVVVEAIKTFLNK